MTKHLSKILSDAKNAGTLQKLFGTCSTLVRFKDNYFKLLHLHLLFFSRRVGSIIAGNSLCEWWSRTYVLGKVPEWPIRNAWCWSNIFLHNFLSHLLVHTIVAIHAALWIRCHRTHTHTNIARWIWKRLQSRLIYCYLYGFFLLFLAARVLTIHCRKYPIWIFDGRWKFGAVTEFTIFTCVGLAYIWMAVGLKNKTTFCKHILRTILLKYLRKHGNSSQNSVRRVIQGKKTQRVS